MAVEFEFACGNERYRIARRTYRHSPTDVVLERFADGDWRSAAGRGAPGGARGGGVNPVGSDGPPPAGRPPHGHDYHIFGRAPRAPRRLFTQLLGWQRFGRV